LFVPRISQEPLNRFARNSRGRRVWSLTWTSLNVKVKGQDPQGQKMCLALTSPSPPPAVYEWYAFAVNSVLQLQMAPLHCCLGGDLGGLRAVCLVKHLKP